MLKYINYVFIIYISYDKYDAKDNHMIYGNKASIA